MTRNPSRYEPAETLHELLDRNHIELHEIPVPGRQHGGARSKIYCPQCGGGREKEKNFFVGIDRDGQGASWHCFRAINCGFSGGERVKNAPERPQRAPKQYRKPAVPRQRDVPESLVAYYEQFGISLATLSALGIYKTTFKMPVIDRDGKQVPNEQRLREVIAYPYVDDKDLLNIKYRAVYKRGDKTIKRFKQEYDCKPTLFNIDSFVSDEWGVIVEGEDDVAAVYEAGWRQVTTLPDGAPSKLSNEKEFDRNLDEDQRYAPLYGEPRLDRLKRVYLAGDADAAGVRHMEEVARRLGKGRCWRVTWPGQCKDGKQTLAERGHDAITHAITSALPYPLEGVVVPTDEEMANLRAGLMDRRILTGHKSIDDRMALNDAGSLIITTGISGRGKTTFWNAMSMLYLERNIEEAKTDVMVRPFHTNIFSAEMKPTDMMARLVSLRSHLPFWGNAMMEGVPVEAMLEDYLPFLRQRFTFVQWPDRATQPPLTWVMERIEENTLRTGAKLNIVDPWQEIDDEMPDNARNHSKWVGKRLQQMVGLSRKLSTNIVLVVHPTKLQRNKEGKILIPEGNEIAESVHFFSRCDVGCTVHRVNDTRDEMLLKVWKTKDVRFGRYGDTELRYDLATHRIWPKPVPVAKSDDLPRAWREVEG